MNIRQNKKKIALLESFKIIEMNFRDFRIYAVLLKKSIMILITYV